MNGNLRAPAAILGITLALGIAIAGGFVANALYEARTAQRFVTVRGLSERVVPACWNEVSAPRKCRPSCRA